MIKSHTGAKKLVSEVTGGDPSPTWENRLKGQQGYGHMSDLATRVSGPANKKQQDKEQEQLLGNLGFKTFEENMSPEMEEDKFVAKGKKII